MEHLLPARARSRVSNTKEQEDTEETSKKITHSSRTPRRWEGKPSQSRGGRHLGLCGGRGGSGAGHLSLMGRREGENPSQTDS